MNNRKGFTLVELLAMLTVLSILMIIAVPNMAGILKNNKNSILIEDVNKMVSSAKTVLNTTKASFPTETNHCVVLTLNVLDKSNDFKKGINDGNYNKDKSYVIVQRELVSGSTTSSRYAYYVVLTEETSKGEYRYGAFDYEKFKDNPDSYVKDDNIIFKSISETMIIKDKTTAETVIRNLGYNDYTSFSPSNRCSGGIDKVVTQ